MKVDSLFQGFVRWWKQASGETLKRMFVIKLLRNIQEMEPQAGLTRKINSI